MFIQENSDVYYYSPEIQLKYLDDSMIEWVMDKAEASSNGQARICMHSNKDDLVHEMFIAQKKHKYVRPHKHIEKSESFHIIAGKLIILLFDCNGKITSSIILDAELKESLFVRIERDVFHMPIALTNVVFHEVSNGPFIKEECVFASWAPEVDDKDECNIYIDKILGCVL